MNTALLRPTRIAQSGASVISMHEVLRTLSSTGNAFGPVSSADLLAKSNAMAAAFAEYGRRLAGIDNSSRAATSVSNVSCARSATSLRVLFLCALPFPVGGHCGAG